MARPAVWTHALDLDENADRRKCEVRLPPARRTELVLRLVRQPQVVQCLGQGFLGRAHDCTRRRTVATMSTGVRMSLTCKRTGPSHEQRTAACTAGTTLPRVLCQTLLPLVMTGPAPARSPRTAPWPQPARPVRPSAVRAR